MKLRSLTQVFVLSAALGAGAGLLPGCKGKGATGGCGVEGDCGGDPTGEWTVVDTCSFPVYTRPNQNYGNMNPYYQPETGVPAPAVTSGNWCWDLGFDKDGMLVTPSIPLQNPDIVVKGTISFLADQTYVYTLTAKSTTKFHVARQCFGVNGANLTCDGLAKKLLESSIGVNPVYTNDTGTPPFICKDQGDGCDCSFDYIEIEGNAVGDKGRWVKDGNVIHHYSIAGQGNLFETNPGRRTVRDATFCVTGGGNTLQLAGTNGQALALKAGLRTLTLTRVIPDAGTDAPPAAPEAGPEVAPPAPDTTDAGTSLDADPDAG